MHSAVRRPIVVSLLFALAACPNRVVVVNGQEMSPAQAEDQGRAELETVRREVKSLPAAEGGERLAALAGRYRGTSFAPEALEKAGELFRAGGRSERAVQVYSAILAEYPLYPRALDVKYLLALSQIESNRARDGLATLDSL